jgi:hypothetical protein
MSESGLESSVSVTAQERTHPAIRRLARACIALARQVVDLSTPPPLADTSEKLPTSEGRAHG